MRKNELLLNFHVYKMSNGLTVIIKKNACTPIAAVNMFYKTGSAGDPPGSAGITHWCEHMLLKGTQKCSSAEIKSIGSKYGGICNGFTWFDLTYFSQTIVKDGLEEILSLEAERMTHAAFDESDIQSELGVITMEILGREADPLVRLDREIRAALSPAHAYRWPTTGNPEDLQSLTRDQLIAHYRKYFVPENAILVIIGDLVPEVVIHTIEAVFGSIPPGNNPLQIRILDDYKYHYKKIDITGTGKFKYLTTGFYSPPVSHEDTPALLMLDGYLTGIKGLNFFTWSGGTKRDSYFYKNFIAPQVIPGIISSFVPTRSADIFEISLFFPPVLQEEMILEKLFQSLAAIKSEGIDKDEIRKLKNQCECNLCFGMNHAGLATLIGYYKSIGAEELFFNFRDKINSITGKDIQRVIDRYFNRENCIIGSYSPQVNKNSQGTNIVREKAAPLPDPAPRSYGTNKEQGLFQLKKHYLNLNAEYYHRQDNFQLIGRPDPESPYVTLNLLLSEAGAVHDIIPGTSYLLLRLLENEITRCSADKIYNLISATGTGVCFQNLGHDALCIQFNILPEYLHDLLPVIHTLLTGPHFNEKEIALVKNTIIGKIQMKRQKGSTSGNEILYKTYYKDHPYGRAVEGLPEEVNRIGPEELRYFFDGNIRTKKITLIAAGNFKEQELRDRTSQWFKNTAVHTKPGTSFPLPCITAPLTIEYPSPHSTTTNIQIGVNGLQAAHPDILPFTVAAYILGIRDTGGRIGRRLREQEGFAYQAGGRHHYQQSAGIYIVSATVSQPNRQKALLALNGELAAFIDHGITEDELAAAKSHFINSVPILNSRNEDWAGSIGRIVQYSLPEDYYIRYTDELFACRVSGINAVIRKYFASRNFITVITG